MFTHPLPCCLDGANGQEMLPIGFYDESLSGCQGCLKVLQVVIPPIGPPSSAQEHRCTLRHLADSSQRVCGSAGVADDAKC